MTDEQTPAPTPSSDPPPLAGYVQGSGPSAPEPMTETAAMPVAPAVAAPAAVAPPPVTWNAPPPAVATAGGRTTLAAIAGVGLIILGILGGLLGLAIAVIGPSVAGQFDFEQYGDFGGVNNPGAVIGGAFAFVGILVVAYSLVYLIGGIGIVRSRGWGRVMGLIVGILSGLFWLTSLSGGGASGAGNGIFFPLVMVLIHVYVVVVLIMFWKNKTA